MTDREEIGKAVEGVAVGYVFLHFDLNLFILNVLPDWLGYLAINQVLDVLEEEEPSASLLKPLAAILIAWEIISSLLSLTSTEITLQVQETIVAVVSLYFHFQLLTNLAEIAKKWEYPKAQNILKLRTVRTLLITFVAMPLPWLRSTVVVTILGIIGIVTGIWICIELNRLKKHILGDSTDNRLENEA